MKGKALWLCMVLVLSVGSWATARITPQQFGCNFPISEQAVAERSWRQTDSLLRAHPYLQTTRVEDRMERLQPFDNEAGDFYLIMGLVLFLGMVRAVHPHYFRLVLRSFWQPGGAARGYREQLEQASFPNLLMNLFFSCVTGVWLYYLLQAFVRPAPWLPGGVLIFLLSAGILLVYLIKYLAVLFSGWAFRVEALTSQYLFSIFLINKIIAIALLPFILLLAFASPEWQEPLAISSMFVAGGLLLTRYVRSWQSFGSFFQYSKFHFITYLCASEVLPLAILLKLLDRYLLH